MKAAQQLGKAWNEITYEDLSKVTLPADQMLALKSILGANIPVNMSDAELFLHSNRPVQGIEKYQTDEYDTIEELLIQEMIETESQLTERDLKKLSKLYDIPYVELMNAYPKALIVLHKRLCDNL